MAYVSYGLDRNQQLMNPAAITIGTDDGGAVNNVTLCINQGVGLQTTEVVMILDAFKRRLENASLGPGDILNI